MKYYKNCYVPHLYNILLQLSYTKFIRCIIRTVVRHMHVYLKNCHLQN